MSESFVNDVRVRRGRMATGRVEMSPTRRVSPVPNPVPATTRNKQYVSQIRMCSRPKLTQLS